MKRFLMLLATFGLVACGGAHGGSASLPVTTSSSTRTSATATLTIPNGQTAPAYRRRVQYVSSSTASIAFTIGTEAIQIFDASSSSPYCTAVTNGRSCTFTFFISNLSGSQNVTVQTFDTNATLLSEATIAVDVVPGTNISLPLTLEGVAASATIAINGSFTFHQSSTLPLTVTVKDPDGNAIIGNAPFDNNASVNLTLPASVPATLVTTPAVGNSSSGTSASITAASTAITLSYTGGSTLGVRVSGSLVTTSTTSLGTVAARVVVSSSNEVDYHERDGNTGNPVTVTSTRAARGPDGDVYFVGTGNGSPAVVRAHFGSGTPTVEYFTVSAISDLAVSASNEVVYASGTSVYTFSANSFPLSTSCNGTLSSYTLPAPVASMAADSSGVFIAYQTGFSDPTYGTAVYIAMYSSAGVYNGGPDAQPNGSAIVPVLTGDPSNATATEFSTNDYGYNTGAQTFTTTASFSSVNTGNSAGNVNQNDGYRFASDPYASSVYLMDTTQYNSTTGEATPVALYTISGGNLTAVGSSLPSSITVAVPAVAPNDAPVIITPSTIYTYEASTTFVPTALTSPTGALSLQNGAVGNDGRIWLTDGTHLLSYPGTGLTGS